MKITFEKDILLSMMTPILGAVSTRNSTPTISGLLFRTVDKQNCEVVAYDLEKGMKTVVPCVAEEEGDFVLNAARFTSIVRSMPDGAINITIDEKNVATVSCGQTVFGLHALEGSDFPKLPELGGEKPVIMKQNLLRKLISKTLFAVANNDAKAVFNGICFRAEDGKFTAVSTDRYTLAVCSVEAEINEKSFSDYKSEFILPGKTTSELYRILSDGDETVEIFFNRKHAVFITEKITLFSRMIEGEFIDYARFFQNENKTKVKLEGAKFVTSLERASIVTEERELGEKKVILRCDFKDNSLRLSAKSTTGKFEETFGVDQKGPDLTIFFTCKRLLDAVRITGVERLDIGMNTDTTGLILTPAEPEKEFPGGSFRILVLPVRPPMDAAE